MVILSLLLYYYYHDNLSKVREGRRIQGKEIRVGFTSNSK